MYSKRRERLRFSMTDDLCLLREVLSNNPYEDALRWKFVVSAVVQETRKKFTMRAIKEHLQHILQLWAKRDRANIRKSGTEEECNKKEALLQQVTDLARECRGKPNKIVKSEFIESNVQYIGGEIRRETTPNELEDPLSQTIEDFESDVETPATPSVYEPVKTVTGPCRNRLMRKKSSLTNTSLLFLREKQVNDKEFNEKQIELESRKIACEEGRLELEEKQLALEQMKFDLEKKEREMRLQMELEERRHRIETEKQQQQIINMLLQKQI